MLKKPLIKYLLYSFLFFLLIAPVIYYFYPVNVRVNSPKKITATDKIKFINEQNSQVIKLNNRKTNLPFHPIKLKILDKKLFYIDSGKLYFINITDKVSKSVQLKLSIRIEELISLSVDINHKRIFLLDKLNNIYSYYPVNNLLKLESRTLPNSNEIEPEYLNIYYDNSLFIIDSAQNKLIDYVNSKKSFVNLNDIDLTESLDLYKDKNNIYILERGNNLKVITNSSLNKEINLIQNTDIYDYLGIFSNNSLKNIYFSGGYNGNILSISKSDDSIKGRYYISINNIPLPVYDISINKEKMYILAGNYLIINSSFKENDFSNSNTINTSDLLDKSLIKSSLKNFLIPVDNYSGMLPVHSSVYPGARRLYRYGIHEGIDFFDDKEGNITVNSSTQIVAAKSGTIIRIDKSYHEMSIKEHQDILNQCLKTFHTSAENIDKLRGRQVWVKHEGNIITVYAHLSKINTQLTVGSEIEKGDLLGFVGNSGTTDGVYKTKKGMHLHFEIHIDDKSKKLEYYLGKYLPIEETMQIYRKILE